MKKVLITFSSNNSRLHDIYTALNKKVSRSELIPSYGFEDVELIGMDGKLDLKIHGEDINTFKKVFVYNVGAKNVINRDIVNLIAQYCKFKKIKFINSYEQNIFSGCKLFSKVLMHSNKVNYPNFVFHSSIQNKNYEYFSNILGEKFVLKQAKSSLGKKVILIENSEDYAKVSAKLINNIDEDGLWFAEEFIPHEETIRGIVTGNKCKVQITVKKENDSFRTNHGQAEFSTKVNKNIAKISIKASKAMKLEVAGIDNVFDSRTNSYKVLEVNKSPGITLDPSPSPEVDEIANLLN